MVDHWREVLGYEGRYQVSRDGRVRNSRGNLLARNPDSCGYLSVKLSKDGKGRTVNVHRIVADAFLGPRPNGYQIAHTDGDRANPAADNLRIVSRIVNERDKVAHGSAQRGFTPRPRSKSKNPHPADGMMQQVDCGGGAWMSIIDPRSFEDGGPEWVMRYGDCESIRFTVASLLSSFDYLLSDNITATEAARRLRLLRQARADCITTAELSDREASQAKPLVPIAGRR